MPETTPDGRPQGHPVGDAEGHVLTRSLAVRQAGGVRVLDAVAWQEGDRRQVRVFCATGTPAGALVADAAAGLQIAEWREVSGGGLVIAADTREPQAPIALAVPDGTPAPLIPGAPEWNLFAGRNTCLALRTVEPPQAVADWVRYHAARHGMDAALIVNRTAKGHAAFRDAVAALIPSGGPRIVLLDAPVPLGKPGLGPESHPFLAPDAPGKDRMEHPAPDPWLSPLGEGLIFEIAKWRFLRHARAVLTLDVSDILADRADGAPTAFDRALAAKDGVILLVGSRIYPWSVRPGQPETHGDHVCRPFDATRGIARWGVAPGRSDPDRTWRSTRVAYAKPDETAPVLFFRAMALRVPGRKPSELAPKTSLIEDPALLRLATDRFGHAPLRPPKAEADGAVPKAHPAEADTDADTVIVTTMKNEGPFILEWIAHHRATGVTGFLVYTNDCTDGTDELLDALAAQGILTRRDNPFRSTDLKPQHAALQAAESEPMVQRADWLICMDVDEFLDVKLGDGTLPDLYAAMDAAMPGANMISATWRLFGNADVDAFEDRFVTAQFPLCAPEVVRKPHQAWGFKTLFRNIDIYKKLGVHRPKGLRPELWDRVRWLNGSGKAMPREMFRNGWRSSTDTYGYDWVSLNHYAVRSAESFLVKRDRGRVNHVDRDQGLTYWFRMNHNAVEDRSIQRRIQAVTAEYDRLIALPGIRAAHEAAVAAHRAKIAELKARPEQAAFHAELTGERMRALSRMLGMFGSAVFTAGPGVIPDDLHRRALPPDFFFTVKEAADADH